MGRDELQIREKRECPKTVGLCRAGHGAVVTEQMGHGLCLEFLALILLFCHTRCEQFSVDLTEVTSRLDTLQACLDIWTTGHCSWGLIVPGRDCQEHSKLSPVCEVTSPSPSPVHIPITCNGSVYLWLFLIFPQFPHLVSKFSPFFFLSFPHFSAT